VIIVPERQESQAPEQSVPEMVERIAKVLWAQKLKPGGGGRTLMAWPACPEAGELRENAREIIAAMEEPTTDMEVNRFRDVFSYDTTDDIWRSLIKGVLT
jgi:hypothetical protein